MFKQWCHAHPFKFATFILCSCVLTNQVTTPDSPASVGVALLFLILVAWIMRRDMRRLGLLSVSLAALLAMPAKAQESQPEVGGVAIGVTVIVIGGVAYYYLTKTCQRLFPKPPEKTNTTVYAGSPADCAASFSYQSPHSCKLPDPSVSGVELVPTVVEIELEAGVIREIRRSKTAIVDYAGFAMALGTHGIRPSERPGEEWYGLNGRPAEAPQVPITFDSTDNSVVVGRGLIHKLTVERSADFEHWEPMVNMSVGAGQRAVVVDSSEEKQMFYRVK